MAKNNVPRSSVPGKSKKRLEVHVPPLLDLFEHLSEWRKARGKVYRLVSLLMVVLAGLLCGKKEVKAIARWCKALPFLTQARMGLPLDRSPSAKTLDRLLVRNVVLALLRLKGHRSIAAAIDFYSAQPERAVCTIGLTTAL